MRFTKMQGIGNDYVYVNCFEEHVENPSELAKQMSRRHYLKTCSLRDEVGRGRSDRCCDQRSCQSCKEIQQ